MHEFYEMIFPTTLGSIGGSMFLLEMLHIFEKECSLCVPSVVVATLCLLGFFYKCKRLHVQESALAIGAASGFAVPFLVKAAHLMF